MFTKTDEELTKMGAKITTREIEQQPELWQETWSIYQNNKAQITDFLNQVQNQWQSKSDFHRCRN